MGLVNRLCPAGRALATAVALAEDLARFPQAVMRADRRSVISQWDMPLAEAMSREFEEDPSGRRR